MQPVGSAGAVTIRIFNASGALVRSLVDRPHAAGAYTKGTNKTEDKDDSVWRLGSRYDGVSSWGTWFAKAGVQQARIEKISSTAENNASGVVTKRDTSVGAVLKAA